jgi:hypothetical protein
MKHLALIVALVSTFLARPAHAITLDFTWESQAWVRTFESPTQSTVTGPFTLSGRGDVTFNELVTGGVASRTLSFDAGFGGTLTATGDGTFNGPMTFPTASEVRPQPRSGLGVMTPTADGFTLVVHRAASGPDAGASFSGIATPLSGSGGSGSGYSGGGGSGGGAGGPIATANEPVLWLAMSAGLAVAAALRSRRPRG